MFASGQTFLLTCHVLPDADAVGSMLGLAEVLRSLGKDVVLYNRDPVPDMLTFLPGVDEIRHEHSGGACASTPPSSPTRRRARCCRAALPSRADHGPAGDHRPPPGARRLRRHRRARRQRVRDGDRRARPRHGARRDPLPQAAAEPLYTALVADTGSFRYPGTTRRDPAARRRPARGRASTRGTSRRTCSRAGRWSGCACSASRSTRSRPSSPAASRS